MPKSPVYGKGRNLKHRWVGKKTAGPHHSAAGGINMKGKKIKAVSCYCCFCIDMRDKVHSKEHRKEIEDTLKGYE